MPADRIGHYLAEDGPPRPGANVPAAGQDGQTNEHQSRMTPSELGALGQDLARLPEGGTPLAMASTPVRAEQPAENAFSTSSTLIASGCASGISECPGWGTLRARGCTNPIAIIASRPTMKE